MLVVDFNEYYELRDYWKKRRKSLNRFKVERVEKQDLIPMRAACVGLKPKDEEGYIVLKPTDVLQQGDEWWSSTTGKWELTRCIGQKPAPITSYRRPFAGDGWRFLEEGELICRGDQYLSRGAWLPTSIVGDHGMTFSSKGSRYRRRIEPEVSDGYVLLDRDDRLQEGDVYKSSTGWKKVRSIGVPVGGAVGYFARPVNPLTETNGASC